jgi:hypothetical protein
MDQGSDLITASRIDLTLALLPAITWLEASCTLAANRVPADVAARVLADPSHRRKTTIDILLASR